MIQDAYIVAAARSAVARGKKDGSLANVHPIDLSARLMSETVKRAGVSPESVDDVLWGCAMPEGSQGLNIARLAVLRSGLPVEVTAATINRFCSSGLQTVAMAAQSIMTGMADVVLAGGVEMMSQVPMSGHHTRLHPEMAEDMIGMGFTAERVANRWKVSREDQDRFAASSHQKASAAWERGVFEKEIVPIEVEEVFWSNGKSDRTTRMFEKDELIRPGTTPETLAKLRPAFSPKGTVTAGNASPYSDGAAAILLMSEERMKKEGLKPLARFVTFATGGVDPDIMGVGPIKAVPKALKRAGKSMSDVSLIEFNEAFAAQALAVIRELGMDESIVNVNGGAIALGHPLGATGAKLTTQLVHELGRRGGGLGLVTMCVGGGMGAAGIIEVEGRQG
jgi:acetyl-CoA acyltransferase